ncbi:MAG: hypothetical protein KGM24_04950 [Elusimicrobia bacterium]|nr:hypothetical protein [Elusimicrobiota bacterium]
MIDPHRQGDGHAVQPPRWRDGRPVDARPWGDRNGRLLPPDRDRIGRIDRDDIRGDIRGVENGWDRGDHGYDWHRWNGMDVCHHYDDWGFHWWGFYVGGSYFWTRWYGDHYWWYDPYWHRWVYLQDGRWWWQDAGAEYVLIDGRYYRYGDANGTIVMIPDATPPVDVPPSDPNAPASPGRTAFYSEDGTRSVLILGQDRDAYLYDLTVTDPNDARAAGRWLASGVKSVAFEYADGTAADGSATKVLRQLDLSFDDPSVFAAVDPNGERKVQVEGIARDATLYDLADPAVAPSFLASAVSGITMFDQQSQDASGETVQRLTMLSLAATDALGRPVSLLFGPDGTSFGSSTRTFAPDAQRSAAPQIRTLERRSERNPALKALKAAVSGWR